MEDANVVLGRLKDNVKNDVDKSEGSFLHDSLSSTAVEFENAYKRMDRIKEKLDIKNLQGNELEERVYNRTGRKRKQATKAKGILEVAGNGVIKKGDLFATKSGVRFISLEDKTINEVDSVKIEAFEAGKIGIVPASQITEIPVVISGITKVSNIEPTFDGFNAESDEELLERYYEIIKSPVTSGNKAQYRNWAKEVEGVGDAKVFPLWKGDNTVKVLIIDVDKKPASDTLIKKVQDYIDPGIKGMGDGIAPLGHFCTIEGAKGKVIDIKFRAVKDSSITEEEGKRNLERNIDKLLSDIAFKENIVSYAKIGALILSTKGFLDYSNLLVNEGLNNISLTDEEVPVRGVVSYE